ncbi:MAG: hypothetical protein M1839_006586 [Geoglossum umbratile]|nr:MAG: hypothetical protein M1839_006586 [Geoglossum umbratile]
MTRTFMFKHIDHVGCWKEASPLVGNEANWLLIFDNVNDLEDLADFWSQFGKGSALVTSLDPLRDHDAARFLLELINLADDVRNSVPEEALAVARRLGVLEKIRGEGPFRDSQLNRWEPKNYIYTIATVWDLESLAKEPLLLDVISLLDPNGIREDILTEGAKKIIPEFYPKPGDSYQEARVELTKRSLVTRNKKEHELRVHRLTQDAARAKESAGHLRNVFNATVVLLPAAWPYAASSGICMNVAEEKWSQRRDARSTLGDIYYTRGAEAAEISEKKGAFLISPPEINRTSSGDDLKLAQAYNQAANARLDQNIFEEALEPREDALEAFEVLPDSQSHDDASRILMDNLRAREKAFGPDDTESFRQGTLV